MEQISEHNGIVPFPSGAVLVSQASAFAEVIERASRDPLVDIAKFRELMLMKRELAAEAAERDYDTCMAAAQAEMRPIIKDSANPQTRSKYASYAALDDALRPIYTRHGFSLSFYTGEARDPNSVRVYCKVAHRGHTERPYIDMPADGKGAKGGDVMTRTHATGSATTYGRRYLLTMIFNIATRDDDGNAAGRISETITPKQCADLEAFAREVNADWTRFMEFCAKRAGRKYLKDIEEFTLAELPAREFDVIICELKKKRDKEARS